MLEREIAVVVLERAFIFSSSFSKCAFINLSGQQSIDLLAHQLYHRQFVTKKKSPHLRDSHPFNQGCTCWCATWVTTQGARLVQLRGPRGEIALLSSPSIGLDVPQSRHYGINEEGTLCPFLLLLADGGNT